MESKDYVPLFETKPAKGRILFRLYAASIFVAICMIFVYRVSYFLSSLEGPAVERWAWSGMFLAELWFSWNRRIVCTADAPMEGLSTLVLGAFTGERLSVGRNIARTMGLMYNCAGEDIMTGLAIQDLPFKLLSFPEWTWKDPTQTSTCTLPLLDVGSI
ncbi:hypothetical protein Pint_09408 [Pistacia integerrima]|uniref:Uncharacterized protein n=1 Tax=Pistacia integerrima TaxID=434235 RepID=A0ACC0XHC3_9ROSI|nr:hypothetical protein Pint_09408 [Pistacia integerrima]